jgi:hypothetical protein
METLTNHTTPQARIELIRAATEAVPLTELEIQALGSKTPWGTQTRPARLQGRRRAIAIIARAGELALASGHDLTVEHVVAAVRSLALRPADTLVCSVTGEFMSTRAAVKHRGEELARAITEAALLIRDMERESEAAR